VVPLTQAATNIKVISSVFSMTSRDELRELIASRSLIKGAVTLSTGQESTYYFDCKRTTLNQLGASLVADAFLEIIDRLAEQPDAIGGLTHGADPILGAVMMRARERGRNLESFYVRKEPKRHGTKQWIENPPLEGSNVLIVDDVVTTGTSILKAIDQAEKASCRILCAIALVDRLQGGSEAIRQRCPQYFSVYTIEDFATHLGGSCTPTTNSQSWSQKASI
jgi:orotate phosphoribosyltransferase